jgi:hypothetical protein
VTFGADFSNFLLIETAATVLPAIMKPAVAVAIPAVFTVAGLVVVAHAPIFKSVIVRHHISPLPHAGPITNVLPFGFFFFAIEYLHGGRGKGHRGRSGCPLRASKSS